MNRFFFACICTIIPAVFLSGCVETALVYDPNVYHTGRTSGDKKAHAHFAVSSGMRLRNSDEYADFRTDVNDHFLAMSAGLSHGLTDRIDWGGAATLGFWDGNLGLRMFLKQMLTERNSQTAVALMPAVVYIHGSTDTDDEQGRTASSHVFALEMHIPISYHLDRRFCLIVEPKAVYLIHRARFEAGPNDYLPWVSRTTKDNWLCPGIAFGMQYRAVLPEVTLLGVDGRLRTMAGLGLNF